MKTLKLIALVLSVIILSSCSTTTFYEAHKEIDSAQLDELTVGVATPSDAIRLLGPPLLHDQKHDGRSVLLYTAEENRVAGLAFDKQGKLYQAIVYEKNEQTP